MVTELNMSRLSKKGVKGKFAQVPHSGSTNRRPKQTREQVHVCPGPQSFSEALRTASRGRGHAHLCAWEHLIHLCSNTTVSGL